MKFIPFLAVALGGAVGSVLRYSISLIPFKGAFPASTLIVNLLGALIIGFIAGFTDSQTANKNLVLFFKTGICGGFTTFSTFSLESVMLFQNGKAGLGIIYVVLSIAGCLLGVWAGISLSKHCG
ncbi:MAG: fluoride efflux transporter CrcB [Hominimerdicola sp.]